MYKWIPLIKFTSSCQLSICWVAMLFSSNLNAQKFPTVIHWFQLCLWPIVDAEGQIKTILPYFMNCNVHLKQKAIKMQVKSHAYCSHCHCKTGVSSATYHSICHSAFCIHLFSWIGQSHYQRGGFRLSNIPPLWSV